MSALDALVAVPPGLYRLRTSRASDAVARGLAARGVVTVFLELDEVRSKRGLLGALERAGRFPAWWGRNWDALFDLLVDDRWRAAEEQGRPTAVVVGNAGRFARRDPDAWEAFLDVLWDAVRRRASEPAPLRVFVRGAPEGSPDAPDLLVGEPPDEGLE